MGMLPSPMTGMMKWTVNGNHHKSTTQSTRVNGNQNKLTTQTIREHGYTQKSITQNTKKINLFTHTILSVELDLIYGKSSLEPSLTTFLSLMILKQLKNKADEEAKNSEPEDDEDDEEFDDEDEDDKEDADEALKYVCFNYLCVRVSVNLNIKNGRFLKELLKFENVTYVKLYVSSLCCV